MNNVGDLARKVMIRLWRIETLPKCDLTQTDQRLGRWLSLAVVAVILITGAVQGARIYRTQLSSAAFYQSYFAAAVHLACNGNYNGLKPNDKVRAFLDRKTRSLESCDGVEGLPERKIDVIERSAVYLEVASAAAWKILGIDWKNLFVVAAVLTAGFALAAYNLLRVFCTSRLLAAGLSLTVMWSSVVVSQIPHLRDFSKGPFVIGSLACIGAAVLRRRQPLPILLLCLGAGALVSVGIGFRPDINVILPIVLLAPALFIGTDTTGRTAFRASCVWVGFAAAYIAFQLPLKLIGDAGPNQPGNFIAHVFLLGFADPFLSGSLGMAESFYDAVRPYIDALVQGLTNLFAGVPPGSPEIVWDSTGYDEASGALLRSVSLLVPYDLLLRVFYTANAIGHLPINSLVWGWPLLLAAPVFLLLRPRCFLFAIVSFGILAAVLSLQYDPRHAFYMVLFGAIIVALSFNALLDIVRHARTAGFVIPSRTGIRIGYIGASLATMVVFLAAASHFLATAQRSALQALAVTYAGIDWKAIEAREFQNSLEPIFADTTGGGSRRAYVFKGSTEGGESPLQFSAFSRLTFRIGPPRCWSPVSKVTANYTLYFTGQKMNVGGFLLPERTGLATYYFPQVFTANPSFTGLKLEGLQSDCIVDWSVATQFPAGTPPAELLLIDGEPLGDFQRGNWATIWHDFVH